MLPSSKLKSLRSEVDPAIAKKAFELVRTATKTFERWTSRELSRLIDYMKILSFQK